MKKAQDFGISAWECMMAKDAFLQAYQHQAPYNIREISIKCGLDAVWQAARKYQAALEAQEHATESLAEEVS